MQEMRRSVKTVNIKYFLLVLSYVLIDQATKILVVAGIPYNSFIRVNDYVNIVNVSNTGVAFSMFQGQNFLFAAVNAVVIAFIAFFIKKRKCDLKTLEIHSLLLIMAGGTGNLADRIFRGAVVDFIDIGYKNFYRWPSFNVADSCVCVGVALFVFSSLFLRDNKKISI